MPDVGRKRRNAAEGAFRHVAFDGGDAVEARAADAVDEHVDEAGKVRFLFASIREETACCRTSGSASVAVRSMISMPKPGSIVSMTVRQEPGEASFVAHRACRADADRLEGIVDAMEEEIEPAGAETAFFERLAQRSCTRLAV
jgi:hypothetical protein